MRIIIVTLVALMGLAGLANAQNLALVLSNGTYQYGNDVPTIARKHQQLVNALEGQGYEVIGGSDLNSTETRQRIGEFAQKVAEADTVVAVINGHIANFGKLSWLIPTDINPQSATGLSFRGINTAFIAQILAKKPGKSVLFVGESGRQLARIPEIEEGLARVSPPRGVMVVSGAYDRVGDILRHNFLLPNVRVSDVLRGDMSGLVVQGDTPNRLMLGGGRFVANTPEQVENALGLTRSQRRNIQQDLSYLGFNTRGIDGLFGPGSRTAIRDWQRRERFTQTGFLTENQVVRLNRQGNAAKLEVEAADRAYWARTGVDGTERNLRLYLQRYPNGLFANRARAELARFSALTDQQAWARASRINTNAAYREYLRDFPNGAYKNIARSRIGAPPAVVQNDAKRVEDALRLDSVTRLLIEQRVAELGYRTGPRDGIFDLATRQGFRGYQRDRGLAVTGYITADMLRRLLLGQ